MLFLFRSSIKLSKTIEVNYKNPKSSSILQNALENVLSNPFITICIGTDRCLGDCLGPLVGHKLVKNAFPYPVYGTLESPIHAVNMVEKINQIKGKHPNLPILAIDASLGNHKTIGNIRLRKGSISPGKGVGKVLPEIGDYSLIAIVDQYNSLEDLTIHTVRLNLVYQMAQIISHSLLHFTK